MAPGELPPLGSHPRGAHGGGKDATRNGGERGRAIAERMKEKGVELRDRRPGAERASGIFV